MIGNVVNLCWLLVLYSGQFHSDKSLSDASFEATMARKSQILFESCRIWMFLFSAHYSVA